MNMDERIARINELYHKSQDVGLNEEEKLEQARLRKEYIESVKGSLVSQLENVDIKEKDGSITNLGERKRQKEDKKNNAVNKIKTMKAKLRSEYLLKRDSLSKSEIDGKSTLIFSRLVNEKAYKDADLVFLYASYGTEVDTFMIFEKALLDGKRVAFPKCATKDNEPYLEFYEINNKNMLKEGYKGILEPDTDNPEVKLVTDKADLCVVPGVVFTRKGYRIGYGKGFYDRFIDENRADTHIGITFKQQLTHQFEAEKTDRCVDMVITEENVYVCN